MAQARNVTADHLPLIATMTQLTKLSLKRCRSVANAGLAELAPLTRLSDLSLSRCYQVWPCLSPHSRSHCGDFVIAAL